MGKKFPAVIKYPAVIGVLKLIEGMSEREREWLGCQLWRPYADPGPLGERWKVVEVDTLETLHTMVRVGHARAQRQLIQLGRYRTGPAAKKGRTDRRNEEIAKLYSAMGGREAVQGLAEASGKEESKYVFDYLLAIDPELVFVGKGKKRRRVNHAVMLKNYKKPRD
jgi:hypothetical protein